MFTLRIALFLFLSTILSFAHAQRPGGRPQGPPIGRVYGKVLDASTHKGAEYATVSLLAAGTDSLVSGTLVRGNGDFELEELKAGTYVLRISFIGHSTQHLAISITQEKPVLDVGNLNIEPDAELLKEVEVVGEKNSMVMKVDRRVYNVEKDISSKGGSAEDVMRNIPGLSVDVDGNVTMRNAAPQILIDGRPTTMTLDQIRSEEIDRVEVITNPSVAFDANTTGGLINVVLNKNDLERRAEAPVWPDVVVEISCSARNDAPRFRVPAMLTLSVASSRTAFCSSGTANAAVVVRRQRESVW